MFKSTTKAAWSEAACMGFVISGKCSERWASWNEKATSFYSSDSAEGAVDLLSPFLSPPLHLFGPQSAAKCGRFSLTQ
jgi:hypothetical protein